MPHIPFMQFFKTNSSTTHFKVLLTCYTCHKTHIITCPFHSVKLKYSDEQPIETQYVTGKTPSEICSVLIPHNKDRRVGVYPVPGPGVFHVKRHAPPQGGVLIWGACGQVSGKTHPPPLPSLRVCVHGASVSDRSLSSPLTKHSPCPDYSARMSTKGIGGGHQRKKFGGEITCSWTFYDGVEGSEGNGE